MTVIRILVLTTLFFFVSVVHSDKSLELVQVLFRHGDRSPVDAYPTSHYQEDFWPNGFDQLTKEGMVQHYELGQFLKKKYIKEMQFLGANYSHREIEIWSSDVDRTLMSAAVDLAGLFPPGKDQIWNPNITWQPIPIHTMPVEEDYYLSYSANCPKYDELQEESLSDEDYIKVSQDNAEFMEKLNSDSGFNGSIQVTNIFKVSDPLRIEKLKKLTLPPWTKEENFWETLEDISAYSMGQLVDSTAKARLRGGPLLGLMIQKMEDQLNTSLPSSDKHKFYMYSAHDVSITSLLSAMKVFNHMLPPYASAVGVELWKDDAQKNESGQYVNIWYRNETTEDPFKLTIPGCQMDCPFERFRKLTKERTLPEADIKRECGLLVTPLNFWIPTIIGIVLGVMLILFVLMYIISINQKKEISHHVLQNEDP